MTRSLLKLAFSLGLLTWLLMRSNVGHVVDALRELSPPVIASILALIPVMVAIAAFKWWLFVPSQRFLRLVRLNLVGTFYSIVLPGQVAGEAVKIYRLGSGRRDAEEIAASVILDKINGMIALLALGVIGAWQSRIGMPGSLLAMFAGVLVVGLVGLYSIHFAPVRRSIESILGLVSSRWSWAKPLADRAALFVHASTRFLARPGLMIASVCLGMAYQLVCISVMRIAAPAFGIDIQLADWLWTFAIVSAAVLLPLSVAGIGIREGAYVAVLGLLHVPSANALALSLTVFATQLVAALCGGLTEAAGFLERRRQPRAE